jgi:hypothetical protein
MKIVTMMAYILIALFKLYTLNIFDPAYSFEHGLHCDGKYQRFAQALFEACALRPCSKRYAA